MEIAPRRLELRPRLHFMSWHWIIDDPTLGPMEKLTLLTIRRQQYGDAAVMLQQETIAQKAGISLRAAQSALAAAEQHGCLEVTRRKNHASSYRVVQRQGLLFSNANFHMNKNPALPTGRPHTESPRNSSIAGMERGYRGQGQAPFPRAEENSVENAAPAEEVHARGAPPGLFGTQVVRTFIRKSSGNSKDKTRAEVRPRAAQQNLSPGSPLDSRTRRASQGPGRPPKDPADEEQRQKIDARNNRLQHEAEMLRDSMVGAGPGLEPEIARTLTRIAQKMAGAEPLSQAEYERRRDDQKQKLEAHLKRAGCRP